MSGSPPFEPARTAHELNSASGGSSRHGMHSDASQTTRWHVEQQPGRISSQPRGLLPLSNTYPQETTRGSHIRRVSDHRLPPLLTHNAPESIGSLHGAPRRAYDTSVSSMTHQHGTPLPRGSMPEPSVRPLSPRSQRKTKGHVASACVPCKKAHLRCDSQRPCARCVSHGKEDTCVDVRHKKRGRPRLRDDRDSRMDAARFSHTPDDGIGKLSNIRPASMGQHHPLYDGPGGAARSAPGSAFSSPEAPGARFLSRVVSADASFHHGGERQPRLAAEAPVVYMRTNMEVVKVSASFAEAVGAGGYVGRRITELVAPETAEAMMEICAVLNAEQKRREPTYLPPIFDKGSEAARALSFASEVVGRLELNHQTWATFRAHDGQPRSYPVRLGLLKEGSIFFIAAVLTGQAARPLYQHGGVPHPRNVGHGLPRASPAYGAPTPIDSTRRQFSDGPSALRREVGMARQSTPQGTSPSSGYQSIYSPSPHGSDYRRPSPLQTPRSELGPPQPSSRPSESHYTLPPIRSLAERPRDTSERDGKQRRLSIGGLINRTGT
ncbi:Zn(2)-C6 fungal-type DNA-binding domain protein [Cordyceps fumosorosea ARSEF 2679]|uniref:Zn(2)-C6 fungal-type DNA-binding domain protein n=1 Tax=Cordyceps fumosorosea (strain ARSEF 2679) TaxID=1081104 RepID=A0A168ALC9_CORFA|nr:Zn(2)-C6 fungal-type DNA-binding domain protein [Cordyceps fumosorosea ARSEF 2679]OAA68907.1 Zn(2)-C6 fungal-type DNA-binding domain protein [Cordyceps fumosorosea ARSEF 2679]